MGKLFYLVFIHVYRLGIGIASFWNPKAKLWVAGRKQFPAIPVGAGNSIWMHCASLGEFEQGRPLLEAIKKQYPGKKIVLTFFSPSGYETIHREGAPGLAGVADYIFYLPMDSQANARQFIDNINPSLVLWVKYEFWYYYLTELKKRKIPVLMVCGLFRESQPFFKWYGGIWKAMLQCFAHFFLQNDTSRELLTSVGITGNVSITGDTRFDRVIEIADKFERLPLIEKFCGTSKVIVAGSTWEEDEEELTHYVKSNPQLKFIIAPHEIDPANIKEVQKEFPGSTLYSEWAGGKAHPPLADRSITDEHLLAGNVLIIDNIGMLSKLYYYADIAFVGGGFVEDGIHNVLEAAVYGKPVLHGPEYEKFAEAVDLVDLQAGIPVTNALELEKVLTALWNDENLLQEKGKAAKNYVYSKAGATASILEYVQENRLLTN